MDHTILRLQVLKRYNTEINSDNGDFFLVSPGDGLEQEFIHTLLRAFEEDVNFRYSEFNEFPTSTIIDYISRTHQLYLNKVLHEIEQSIGLLNEAYPSGHELLELLNDFYIDYKCELISHIREEDQNLIPYIQFLESVLKNGVHPYEFIKQKQAFNIEKFFDNHEENDSQLDKIALRIRQYEPPHINRFVYGVLLNQLELFEHDLRVHGMIEEQVLIPRALEMERKANELFLEKVALN